MIKNTVFNFGKIIRNKGKYAVKYDNFFDLIDKYQKELPRDYFFKPLRSEIEITNLYNQNCKNCGMMSNAHKESLNKTKIDYILSELNKNKIPSIAITGGEPFLNPECLYYIVKESTSNNIDISKITSNGFWGESNHDIDKIFKKLINNNLLSNKYFIPLIMLSIGQQKVGLSSISNIIHYIFENFNEEQIHIGISSLNINGHHKVNLLKENYNKKFKNFPENNVYITYSDYVGDNCNKKYKLLDMVESCYMCFNHCVGSYVLPTILIKLNGDIFACSCFNVPKQYFFLGNIYKKSLSEILANANQNKFIKIIKDYGIRGLIDILPQEEIKTLENIKVDSYCEACKILLDKTNKIVNYI